MALQHMQRGSLWRAEAPGKVLFLLSFSSSWMFSAAPGQPTGEAVPQLLTVLGLLLEGASCSLRMSLGVSALSELKRWLEGGKEQFPTSQRSKLEGEKLDMTPGSCWVTLLSCQAVLQESTKTTPWGVGKPVVVTGSCC